MSSTSVSTSHAITAEQFDSNCFQEYVDRLSLKPYMGTSTESIIHINERLVANKGDAVTFNLAAQIDGDGVQGDSSMEGNEEAISFYGDRVTLDVFKNAVLLDGDLTEQRTPFDIKTEAKPQLTVWLAQKTEKLLFQDLASIDGVLYSAATESEKDTWLGRNSDRVLFGAAVSNNSSNDHSASLLNVDGTADILKTETISLAKRMAQAADPKIRPIKIENGEEYYVMFVHRLAARDLKNTDAWKNAQQYARERGESNPLFTGMLGVWDGVILKEADKCPLLSAVGASSINVAINFLCGAQALLLGQGAFRNGSRVALTEKMFDYETKWGCQIKSMFGHKKASFNNKQHGVVTVYTAAVAD